jgi:hypothetical protein
MKIKVFWCMTPCNFVTTDVSKALSATIFKKSRKSYREDGSQHDSLVSPYF